MALPAWLATQQLTKIRTGGIKLKKLKKVRSDQNIDVAPVITLAMISFIELASSEDSDLARF